MRRLAALLLLLLVLQLLARPPPLQSSASVCDARSDSGAPHWLSCDTGSAAGQAQPGLRLRTYLWAVRHGEAEHNLDPVHGWKIPDPALARRGWRQASAAGAQLPYDVLSI